MSGGWPTPPPAARETLVHLPVRRFFCQNHACPRVTYAEQVTGLTSRYARRTTGLGETLGGVALALGGRAGARLSGRLACPASRSTLLRLIRALPEPPAATPRVLGVDDFALRRGHIYGTVLVDIETRRPVDLLPERSADSFGSWLDSRPGGEVICRDRGGCYAEGAARSAPLAVQVADRWHLLHNLADAVERATARHRSCLRDEPAQPQTAPAVPATPKGQQAQETSGRHAEIHAALARGLTITQISRTLHLGRKTVRRYATTPDPGDLCSGTRAVQPGLLDPRLPYLHQRWDEAAAVPNGYTRRSALAATAAACARCAATPPGSVRTARRRPAHQRPHRKRWPPGSSPPPGNLTDDDRAALDAITGRCPELAATRALVRDFASMLTHRTGSKFPGWAGQAEASTVRELRGFAAGLRKDWPAVTAGLTLPGVPAPSKATSTGSR